MAVQYLDLDDNYTLKNQQKLSLEVSVGDGQPTYSVSAFLDQERKGTSESVDLGSANEVAGKRAMVVVVVQDRLEETNWTSCTVTFKQGAESQTFGPYKKEAEKHLDTVIYTLKVKINE